MFRLRSWSALILAVALTPALQAQDKASPWVVDRSLSVTPQVAPTPALRYRLLPITWDLKDGNAVPIYLRLAHERNDATRKEIFETPRAWNKLPVHKVPRDEAHKFLEQHRYMLRQFELGARRRNVEWHYTLDEPNPIGLLLPDIQWLRQYVPMQILQARVALADKDFAAAAHHLETGFAFSRHLGTGPTLIHSLVGMTASGELAAVVADFVEQPGAPNLYWALAALPRPLIDIRKAVEWEYRMVEMQLPELYDRDRERTAEQWDAVLRHVRTEMRKMARLGGEGEPRYVDWLPKHNLPDEPAARSPDLPAARKFVAASKGLSAAQVEAMPPAQVLLLYTVATYEAARDDAYRASLLPYPEARPLLAAAHERLKEGPMSEGRVIARLFLPALGRVRAAETRLERNLAALRVIEALRLYAAAHNGLLPDKLSDVKEVPIPNDPGTGRPFQYTRDDATATLISEIPDEAVANNGVHYRVTMRKN